MIIFITTNIRKGGECRNAEAEQKNQGNIGCS